MLYSPSARFRYRCPAFSPQSFRLVLPKYRSTPWLYAVVAFYGFMAPVSHYPRNECQFQRSRFKCSLNGGGRFRSGTSLSTCLEPHRSGPHGLHCPHPFGAVINGSFSTFQFSPPFKEHPFPFAELALSPTSLPFQIGRRFGDNGQLNEQKKELAQVTGRRKGFGNQTSPTEQAN